MDQKSISKLLFSPILTPLENFFSSIFSKFKLNFNLNYNSWVKFNIILGFASFAAISLFAYRKITSYLTFILFRNRLRAKTLIQKYGQKSYMLIGDINDNLQYAKYGAQKGFNLILLGSRMKLQDAEIQIKKVNPNIKIIKYEINWDEKSNNTEEYKKILQSHQHLDISIIVTPKIQTVPKMHFSSQSPLPNINHIFLLVHIFLKKLKNRSYHSAIIINSNRQQGKIEEGYALLNGALTSVDIFGRNLNYEMKDFCDVIVARSTVEDAMKKLGKMNVSE